MTETAKKLRLAAVGDLHCREHDHGRFRRLVREVNERADVLLLCGDLTDHGALKEGQVLAEELSSLRVPCAAVLGNHDFDQNVAREIASELTKVGVRCLDGDAFFFQHTLGVAGVKGFGGGFGKASLQAFGEPTTKAFVQEAVNEALKLETALGRLDTPKKVVIMHYSPIVGTLEGENCEIFSYMGSGRFAVAIEQYGAQMVFHGHAHHGTLSGKTDGGVPVFNVALPLLERHNPDQRFALVEI